MPSRSSQRATATSIEVGSTRALIPPRKSSAAALAARPATTITDKLKETTAKPVRMIINPHTHFDHVGGNADFPAGVEIVAHEETARLMKEMRPVAGGPPQPNPFKESNGRGLPTRTFKDRLTLGSGDERIELYWFGRGHTGGDAWVVFPA